MAALKYEQQYKNFYSQPRISLKNDTIYINKSGKPWSNKKYQKQLMKMRTDAINN